MNSFFLLSGGVFFLCIFNFFILLWLGFTVLLNSDKKRFGIWIAGFGLLIAAFFFSIHALVLSYDIRIVLDNFYNFARVISVLILVLPFSWYLLILWYSKFTNSKKSFIHSRHKYFLIIIASLFIVQFIAVLMNDSFNQIIYSGISKNNIYLIFPFSIYIIFILSCTLFSIEAILNPQSDTRIHREKARKKALPWVLSTSILLLLVSLMVMFFLFLFYLNYSGEYSKKQIFNLFLLLYKYDLYISFTITLAVISLGQAIVSYEIFTGEVLPRKTLRKNWYYTLIVGFFYSFITTFFLGKNQINIYNVIFVSVIISIYSSFLNYKFYKEKELYGKRLRSLITSLDFKNNTNDKYESKINHLLVSLCENILESQEIHLFLINNFELLNSNIVSYPKNREIEADFLNNLINQFSEKKLSFITLEKNEYHISIAVSLWNDRGLSGILLIGNKLNRNLYSQEEIDISQSMCERLIELTNNQEMYKWFINYHKNKLRENLVQDRQLHRILHDDILPEIHLVMLELNNNSGNDLQIESLSDIHNKVSELLHSLPSKPDLEIERLGLVISLKNFVNSEVSRAFSKVNFNSEKEIINKFDHLPLYVKETLFYATQEIIRNSVKYASGNKNNIEDLELNISFIETNELKIVIEDNGVGINTIKQNIGTKKGLKIHRLLLTLIEANLIIESIPDKYTRVTITLKNS